MGRGGQAAASVLHGLGQKAYPWRGCLHSLVTAPRGAITLLRRMRKHPTPRPLWLVRHPGGPSGSPGLVTPGLPGGSPEKMAGICPKLIPQLRAGHAGRCVSSKFQLQLLVPKP